MAERTSERLVAGINTLPEVTRDDSGKVLGVNEDGKWVIKKDEADPELPVPTAADAGKIPSVDAQGKYVLSTPEKELPAVSSADNGKVLGVVDGAWAAKVDQGGADTFLISFTATLNIETEDFDWTCDKTKEEIAEAAEAGKILKAKVAITGAAEAVTYSYVVSNGVYGFTMTAVTGSNVIFVICSENNGASGQIIPLQIAQG